MIENMIMCDKGCARMWISDGEMGLFQLWYTSDGIFPHKVNMLTSFDFESCDYEAELIVYKIEKNGRAGVDALAKKFIDEGLGHKLDFACQYDE